MTRDLFLFAYTHIASLCSAKKEELRGRTEQTFRRTDIGKFWIKERKDIEIRENKGRRIEVGMKE